MGSRLLALVLVAAAATACLEKTPLTPDVNMLVVHAVLDPGAQHQFIVVQTTTGDIEAQRQVTGAAVTVVTPDGRTVVALERTGTAGVQGHNPFPAVTNVYDLDLGAAGLIPGGTYQLRVVAPDGRTVTGRTTVPSAVTSTTADPTQTIDRDRDTVSLKWSRVPGARGYEINVRSTAGIFSMYVTDTSVVLPGTMQVLETSDDVFERRLTHQILVVAVDENYFDYYHRTSDLLTAKGLVMHLDGGIGLFGSAVTIATRTVVVK